MKSALSNLIAFSASEVALWLVALQYAVLAPAWAIVAWQLRAERRATLWWAAYAAGSAVGFMLVVHGMHSGAGGWRSLGNTVVTLAMLGLQRGVWAYVGQSAANAWQGLMLVTALFLTWVLSETGWGAVRIGGMSVLWSMIYGWIGLDLWRFVRRDRYPRWGWLFATPMWLAAAMMGARALRALVSPETVMSEVVQTSVLSLGSAIVGMVSALVLQLGLVGLLLSNLVSRLAKLARHDALTGLLNRRAMTEYLEHEAQRVRWAKGEASGAMALLTIDLDHMQGLNDSDGHRAGDRALQTLAATMRAQMRDIDHLARWDGEEFVALLPTASGVEAAAVAERLCRAVAGQALAGRDRLVRLTASIGLAEWLGPHDSVQAMLERADSALLVAKRDGGGCVRRSTAALPLTGGQVPVRPPVSGAG